jgi:dCMP deaminase
MRDNDPMSEFQFTEFKDYVPPSWDVLFMRLAYEFAAKSKDPRTKIGAVFVRNNKSPLQGFNGICQGVEDKAERLERPEKYHWIEHAERNVVDMAASEGIATAGGTIYTQGIPCVDCTKGVVNAKIKEIVVHKQWRDAAKLIIGEERDWMKASFRSCIMLDEAGIIVREMDAFLGVPAYYDGKTFLV